MVQDGNLMEGKERITFDRKRTLVILGCFVVMAVFWVIPPIEPISVVGMRTLGVFLGTVLLLSLADTTWPAILCIPLFALTGVMTMNEAIMGSLGNWITMFVIMSFVLTYALNTTGFTTRLTALYMGSKWVSRSPWVFTIALVFLGMIVGWFLDPVPTVAFFMTFSIKSSRNWVMNRMNATHRWWSWHWLLP